MSMTSQQQVNETTIDSANYYLACQIIHGRCFLKEGICVSQGALLLAATVWIRGVVQNLLWPELSRDCAIINLLDTALSAACLLPARVELKPKKRREKRTSGLTSWKDIGTYRRKKTSIGEIIHVSMLCSTMGTEKAKVGFALGWPAAVAVSSCALKRLPAAAMHFPTRTWCSFHSLVLAFLLPSYLSMVRLLRFKWTNCCARSSLLFATVSFRNNWVENRSVLDSWDFCFCRFRRDLSSRWCAFKCV